MARLEQAEHDLELARTQLGGLVEDIGFLEYDYGYIHPDTEQDFEDRLLPLAQLIGAYQTSWSRFVGILNLRNSFDSYFSSGNVVTGLVEHSGRFTTRKRVAVQLHPFAHNIKC